MSKISRRGFVEGSAAGLVVATTAVPLAGQDRAVAVHPEAEAPPVPHTAIKLAVNGVEHKVVVPVAGVQSVRARLKAFF